jgi:hypothetical protein
MGNCPLLVHSTPLSRIPLTQLLTVLVPLIRDIEEEKKMRKVSRAGERERGGNR